MSIQIDASKGIRQNTTEVTKIPVGTTAQRPANPAAGMIRINTDQGFVEWYDNLGDLWLPVSESPAVIATGGTVTDIEQDGKLFRVHTFTSDGTFDVTRGGDVEYLVVAGGGGGTDNCGAGGGAGGLLTDTVNVTPQAHTISVGAGGSGTPQAAGTAASNGQNSLAFGFTAIGGGAGGQTDQNGFAGGSGGGGKRAGSSGGAGTAGQGNAGGSSNGTCAEGSGGGAGSVGGSNGNPGGIGISSSISGTAQFYAGGGSSGSGTFSQGGLGGGGSATEDGPFQNIANGTPNTGGGGAGGSSQSSQPSNAGGAGGSGIVIVRYRIG